MEEATEEAFGVWDYVVFGAMLAVSSSIGLYYRFTGGRQKTDEEYLLGDRNMSVLPVAFSLMASFMSSITLLGVTQENYTFGTQFVAINLAYIIGTPVSAYVFLPVFFRLQSPSAYAYLEKRFGHATRLAASIAFTLQMMMYMGIVVYAPALALSAVTGLSFIGSILAVGGVCTFYSTLGGMKAVLLTDVFQSLLMYASIIAVIVVGSISVGGLAEVWQRAEAGGRINFLNLSPDPTVRHTLWTQMIGGVFTYCSLYAVNQAQVQRLLSIGSLRRSQLSLWLQWPILTALSLCTSFAGLTIYAHYAGCDPVRAGRIAKGDQLLPLFVVDTMRGVPGLPGLFVAGIFSGSLSTVSSAINSLAAVAMEDYIKPHCNITNSTLLLKVLALFYGLLCIGLTFLVEFLGPGVLQASLTIFGVVGGPLLGLFTLGMVFRSANQPGALVGLASSLALLFWMGFGQPRPAATPLDVSLDTCDAAFLAFRNVTVSVANKTISNFSTPPSYFYLYRVSYAWYAFIGFVVSLLIGWVSSLVFSLTGWAQVNLAASSNPDLYVLPVRKRMLAEIERLRYSQYDTRENLELQSTRFKC